MRELKLMQCAWASVLLGCIAAIAICACSAASLMSESLAARKAHLARRYEDAQDAEAHFAKHGVHAFSADCSLLELAERFGVERCWLNPNDGLAGMELRLELPACMSSASAERIEVRSCWQAKADKSSESSCRWNVRVRTRSGTGFASVYGGFRECLLQDVLDERRPCFRELQAHLRESANFEWRHKD